MSEQNHIRSLEHAKIAKAILSKKFPNASVGIFGEAERGYEISIRVSTEQERQAIPKECKGVPITAHVFSGTIKKL